MNGQGNDPSPLKPGEQRLRRALRQRRPSVALTQGQTRTGTILDSLGHIEQQLSDLIQYLLARLLVQIDDHFDEEELRTLCFGLGIEYENLPARTRSGRARDLVTHCLQRGRIHDLILAIEQERPHLSL